MYMGFRLGNGHIEHVLRGCRDHGTVRVPSDECFFAKLMRVTHVISSPVVSGNTVRYVVVYNKAVERLVRKEAHRVRRVEVVGYSKVALTDRQRRVLRMLGRGRSIANISREMGVSRAAVAKMVRSALRKVALLH